MTDENGQEKCPEEAASEKGQDQNTFSVKEIQDLQEQAREFKEKYFRVLADSENARKRMQKEKQDLTKYAVENVISEFLLPLDSFEKALKFAKNMSDEVKNWALGFEMILAQFKQVLTNHGIVEYESMGKTFDPHLHEAVEILETEEYKPGTIIQEFTRGYKMGDRIIRVSKVKVAKSTEKDLESTENAKSPSPETNQGDLSEEKE